MRRSSVDYKLMRAKGMTDEEIKTYYKYINQQEKEKEGKEQTQGLDKSDN